MSIMDAKRGVLMIVIRYINGIPVSGNEIQRISIANEITRQTFLKISKERIHYQKKETKKRIANSCRTKKDDIIEPTIA